MVAAAALQIMGAGLQTFVWWPISWSHFLYCSLFFVFGYGLHSTAHLLDYLKTTRVLGSLLTFGSLSFLVQLACTLLEYDAVVRGDLSLLPMLWPIKSVVTGITAMCWTVSLVGIAERLLQKPSAVVRWLVDSSYWIYVMHLPVIALLTFWLANLDRQGRLREATRIEWDPNVKFILATVLILAIGLATYQILVRHTPINSLFNGRRPRHLS